LKRLRPSDASFRERQQISKE